MIRLSMQLLSFTIPKSFSDRLKILENLQSKTTKSVLLNKLLGHAYLGTGDTDNAQLYFKKWLENTKRSSDGNKHAVELESLATRLVQDNKLPKIALEAAKQFAQYRKTSKSYTTLGTAYMLNNQYDEAF